MGFPPRDRSRPLRFTAPVPVPAPANEPSSGTVAAEQAVEKLGKGLAFWFMHRLSARTRTVILTVAAFGAGGLARQVPIVMKAIGLQTVEQAAADKKDLDDKISAAVSKQQTSEGVEAKRWEELATTLKALQTADTDNAAKIDALTKKLAKRSHAPKEPSDRPE